MRLQGEVPGVQKLDNGIGIIPAVGLRSGRDKERIMLAPNGEQRRLAVAEIFLKNWIEDKIRSVIEKEIELDVFLDYARIYPLSSFSKIFQRRQAPLLAIWGKHDPFFIPAGAEAYRRDNPNAVVEFLDTGHFALETHFEKIAGESVDSWTEQVTALRRKGVNNELGYKYFN